MKLRHAPTNAALLALVSSAIAVGCGDTDSESKSGSKDASTEHATGGTSASGGGNGGTGGSSGSSTGGTSTGGTSTGGTSTGGTAGSTSTGGTAGSTSTGGSAGAAGKGSGGVAGLPSPRRPFLIGKELRSAALADRSDWLTEIAMGDATLDPTTRDELYAAWLKDGLEEHASIAAFARLTLLLLSFGAPPELVDGAQRASLDEIVHAKFCFAIARHYAGSDVGPGALDLERAFEGVSLVDLARLVAAEGCVGETLGSIVAREQLATCKEPAVARCLERVVRDELRHAELSWRLAGWLTRVGGDAVLAAMLDSAEEAIRETLAMPERSLAGVDLDVWHAHGRITCTEARTVTRIAIDEIVRPALARLSAKPFSARSTGMSAIES